MGRLGAAYTTASKIAPRIRKHAGKTHVHGNFHWDNTALRVLELYLKRMSIEVHEMYFNGYDDICIDFMTKKDEFVFDLSFNENDFDEHFNNIREKRAALRNK